jgi:DNA-binding NarL/FixJ family response regulator
MEETEKVAVRLEITHESRRHLRMLSAESGIPMTTIIEEMIEREWKNARHTAEYSARYAGTHTYKTHADERQELILKLHSEGKGIEQIAAALPRHLRTTLDGVKSIVQADADADLVEQMRGEE